MGKFDQPTLVRYSSITADEGGKQRKFRPRTIIYGGLMTALTASAIVLLVGRVPFEATVNRAPGTLYQVDADGYVRNTYLLKITNNEPTDADVDYFVRLDGLDGAQLLTQRVTLGSEETKTVPLIIRMAPSDDLARTIPFLVEIASPSAELLLPTTFKTPAEIGGGG
jgi:polyferredoxin